MFTKKAITPVVATALLMTIAVIAVIGFQDWFQNFSTTILTDTEQKITNTETLKIDKIINNNLYLNTNSNTTIQEISINGIICNKNIKIEEGTQNIDISICLKNLEEGKHTILIKTNQGIKEKYFYKKTEQFTDNSNEIITKSINGLVGYWNFDDKTAKDVSGNANHGTLKTSMKWRDTDCASKGCFEFNGINNSIQIANPENFNFNKSLTLIAWIKPKTLNQPNRPEIIAKGGHAIDYRMRLVADGALQFPTYGLSENYLYTKKDTVTLDWGFIALTYNNDTKKIYYNGELISKQTGLTGNIDYSLEPVRIGATGSGEYFNGLIDEVAIYNKELTEIEIKSIYNKYFITQTQNTIKLIDFENPDDKNQFNCNNCEIENGYFKSPTYEHFTSTEFIKITPNCQYEISGDFKSLTENQSKIYFGYKSYDKNKDFIAHNQVNYYKNTETQLYSDISIGDTTINITNGSNWLKTDKMYLAYNIDETGNFSDLPNRNLSKKNEILNITKKSDHYEIKFANSFEKPAKTGTHIRVHYVQSGTYSYSTIGGNYIPNIWTNYTGTASYAKNKLDQFSSDYTFGQKTEYIQFLILSNYDQYFGEQVGIDNLKITETCFN